MAVGQRDTGATVQNPRISMGVSACLLGSEVRFDGGHKRQTLIADHLSRYFDFVPICPEVAIGLNTPREPIRLVGSAQQPHAVGVKSLDLDVTARLKDHANRIAAELTHISGYIFKKNSPSCGVWRVKVYDTHGVAINGGRGIHAAGIMEALPLLPVEEEGRLLNPALRANFLERVLVYRRWQDAMFDGATPARLVAFHTEHKYLILTRGQTGYRGLGHIVASAGAGDIEDTAHRYIHALMSTLQHLATPARHTNVLMHMLGYFKRSLESADKHELLDAIDAYRRQRLPLAAPLTLLCHHLRRHPQPYLINQRYLEIHGPNSPLATVQPA